MTDLREKIARALASPAEGMWKLWLESADAVIAVLLEQEPVGKLEVFTGHDRLTTFRQLPEGKHALYLSPTPPIQRCGRKGQCETEIEQLRAQLAAAQAVIEQMREALTVASGPLKSYETCEGKRIVFAALALPTDNTALRDRLRQERERVSQMVRAGKVKQTRDEGTVVVDWDSSEEAADAVLAMGDE